jgi:4-diphosphocytidyl-2-C-methyl-D-erythritol kinase
MTDARITAHAKVNLALSLAAPEPAGSARAGWHRICTWMHAIDLADEVLVEPLGEGGISTWSAHWAAGAPRTGLVDWPIDQDLAWRALLAIQLHTGRRLPTRLVLTKRIPTGAGLGGGSSDAAAALLGIDRAWGLGLGLDTLRRLGAKLGSDVPFFIDDHDPPRPGVVGGFGEFIEHTGRTAGNIVLLVPGFGCPTGAVYGAFDTLVASGRAGDLRESRVRELAASGSAADLDLFNDLADAACLVRPELGALRDRAAEALGCPVHITGSGSAMFVLPAEGDAARVAAVARSALPEIAVCPSRLI